MFKWLNKIRLKGLPTKTDNNVLVVDDNGDIGINTSGGGSFVLEDGDTTEVTITNGKEVKFVEGNAGIDINWTDTDNGTDSDPYDLTFTNTQYKKHRGNTYGWILPSDFVSDKGNLMYESGGVIDSTADALLYAHFLIPAGATATHVTIYCNTADPNVTVYQKIASSATETSKGTGNPNSAIDITDVSNDDDGVYLAIKMEPSDYDTNRFYGGMVTLS